jgi:uncharacterized phage-associated protein
MALHPFVAAKRVCELGNWEVPNLEINKILYLAHMVLLGRTDGVRSLVTEHFQAWDYGPVLPTVYHRAKAYGNEPVQNVFVAFPSIKCGQEAEIIAEAMESVQDKEPGELIAITHWNRGGWAKHYRPGANGIIIPNSDILEEYKLRVQ